MGSQPIRIQLGKILREIVAGKSCGKLLRENLAGNCCGKLLQENLAGNCCGKLLWENLAGNCCGKILREIPAGKSCGKWRRGKSQFKKGIEHVYMAGIWCGLPISVNMFTWPGSGAVTSQ